MNESYTLKKIQLILNNFQALNAASALPESPVWIVVQKAAVERVASCNRNQNTESYCNMNNLRYYDTADMLIYSNSAEKPSM